MSGKTPLAKAIRYALARLPKARPYLDHGVLELDNNTAERAMRSVAIGRKNYLFVGSQTGGKAAAIAFTLIETAKLNGIDSQHGWPISSPVSQTTRSTVSTTCCRGKQRHSAVRPDAYLLGSYNEPTTLSYQIRLFGPTSPDVRHTSH
ncbi:MAG: hypothetical protein ACI90Y_001630 [Polaromonas sp.]|jgi:hypothetical protein